MQELGITLHLGLNGVASPLVAMAGFVGLAADFAAIHSGAERIRLYLALLTLMQAGLMGFFASVDLFFYFLFHEFALVPTVVSICLFTGIVSSDEAAKKLAYVGFGVPFVAGVLLFLWFEGAVGADYKYEVLFDRTGLQELGITFHLGLNGVSSPLFAMAGFVGLAAGFAAIHSGAERILLFLVLLTLLLAGLMGFFASV